MEAMQEGHTVNALKKEALEASEVRIPSACNKYPSPDHKPSSSPAAHTDLSASFKNGQKAKAATENLHENNLAQHTGCPSSVKAALATSLMFTPASCQLLSNCCSKAILMKQGAPQQRERERVKGIVGGLEYHPVGGAKQYQSVQHHLQGQS